MFTRLQARLLSSRSGQLKVVNDVAKQQFTVSVAGEDAVLEYEQKGSEIKLLHTEVPAACMGKGVGKLLAKHAFDHAKDRQLRVTCECHFLAKYYLNNKDKYKDIKVTIDESARNED